MIAGFINAQSGVQMEELEKKFAILTNENFLLRRENNRLHSVNEDIRTLLNDSNV